MKAYTYNDRLVGVGNDQILGTDQGGGSTYTAGNGIDITNDVISVDDTVAMVSALPTTELGKFTIQSNVSGGPIEVICPTDQAPDKVFYQINSVTGNVYAPGTSTAVINYYYGETAADFSNGDDNVLFTIDGTISNINSIYFYYTNSTTGIGGPSLATTSIAGDATGVLQRGTYRVKAQYNQAGTSGDYGKYLQIMINWRNYASGSTQSEEWAQDVLSKITFFGIGRPDPTLGSVVNLDRYYLGNTSTTTSNTGVQAVVYTDPTTKKQTVYMPSSMPSGWKSEIITSFQYGSNYNSPSSSSYDTKQYRAYKYTSSPRRYQFAYCTDWDYANSIMTFIAYDNSGNAIEKWTLNYSNYSSNVWTTQQLDYASEAEIQAVSGALDDYIPYSASGVYLPNSKFEIDTEGQAYKLNTANIDVINNTKWNGYYVCMEPVNNTNWTKGTYEININPNVSFVNAWESTKTPDNIRIGWYDGSNWSNYTTVNISNNKAIWDNQSDFTYTQSGNNYLLFAFFKGSERLYGGNTSNLPFTSILFESFIPEEYLTVGDLELNDNNQVTAIDGYALAGGGGTTYTAGQYISIDSNDVIAVTGLAQADWAVTAVDSPAYIENKPETLEMEISPVTGGNCISITEGNAGSIDWITTAGITDIISVSALPDTPVATVIYLIPET